MYVGFQNPNSQGIFVGLMDISFQTQHKYITSHRTRSISPTKICSVIVQTYDSGENPPAESGLGQENTVGVIGGASASSTLVFLEKLVWWGTRRGNACPAFVVSGGASRPDVESLRRRRAFLEESGARCVVMPCHVSHALHGEVAEGSSLPFLHAGECVAEELLAADLKPLEVGGDVKIGVIAADEALVARIYQEKLESQGFEVVLPDKATMEHIVIPSIEALRKKDMKGAQNLLKIAVQILLMRAANTVIIASDEMQGLIPHDDPLRRKCTDPMDALARSTIKWAMSKQKMKIL